MPTTTLIDAMLGRAYQRLKAVRRDGSATLIAHQQAVIDALLDQRLTLKDTDA